MNELKEEDKIKLMNDVADVLEKLLTNLITHIEDNSLAEIMQLIETYTAKKELEARLDENTISRDRFFPNGWEYKWFDERINQLSSQLTNNKEEV
jgi:Na+/phosphate symporter